MWNNSLVYLVNCRFYIMCSKLQACQLLVVGHRLLYSKISCRLCSVTQLTHQILPCLIFICFQTLNSGWEAATFIDSTSSHWRILLKTGCQFWYALGIEKPASRYQKCVDLFGNYVEKLEIVCSFTCFINIIANKFFLFFFVRVQRLLKSPS